MSLQFRRWIWAGAINMGAAGMWLIFKATRLGKITILVRVPAGNRHHGVNKRTIYKGVDKSSGKPQGKIECDILFLHPGLKGLGEEVVN